MDSRCSSGKVSSVELTEAVLARVEELEPQIHSYITVTREEALSAARTADETRSSGNADGPLAGIPQKVKDNLSTEACRPPRVQKSYWVTHLLMMPMS